jgi:hypothetical protein
MNLADYIASLNNICELEKQRAWYARLEEQVDRGLRGYREMDDVQRQLLNSEFQNRLRTEEIKAWYGAPEEKSLFQGTSISSLTIPAVYASPLELTGIEQLEGIIADSYIKLHDRHEGSVRKAIVENVEDWIAAGLYYGITIASKLLSQAFKLSVPAGDVVFDVNGYRVDPHEIISYPQSIREFYFKQVCSRLDCFGPVDFDQEEMESSLILADISKPRLECYKNQIFLAPIRCNEIASVLATNVRRLIIEKTAGRISPPSLAIVIMDTDTPYTYHHLIGGNGNELAPVLPGLTVLGSSGTIDAFNWLYTYRVSLISQKVMKSSLYSEVQRSFVPFMFFGVLVPRDAEILLNMAELDMLRYRGNLSPQIEFCYLIPRLQSYLERNVANNFREMFKKRLV